MEWKERDDESEKQFRHFIRKAFVNFIVLAPLVLGRQLLLQHFDT